MPEKQLPDDLLSSNYDHSGGNGKGKDEATKESVDVLKEQDLNRTSRRYGKGKDEATKESVDVLKEQASTDGQSEDTIQLNLCTEDKFQTLKVSKFKEVESEGIQSEDPADPVVELEGQSEDKAPADPVGRVGGIFCQFMMLGKDFFKALIAFMLAFLKIPIFEIEIEGQSEDEAPADPVVEIESQSEDEAPADPVVEIESQREDEAPADLAEIEGQSEDEAPAELVQIEGQIEDEAPAELVQIEGQIEDEAPADLNQVEGRDIEADPANLVEIKGLVQGEYDPIVLGFKGEIYNIKAIKAALKMLREAYLIGSS